MSDWQSKLEEYKVDKDLKERSRKDNNFRPFKEAPPSNTSPSELVELEAIDLSKYKDGPEGLEERKKLAATLERGLTTYGFAKLTNFGVPQEKIEEILSLSQSTMEVPDEIKANFVGGEHDLPEEAEQGRVLGVVSGSGYKPLGYWKYENNTPDNIDLFNFRHFAHYDTFFNRIEYPEFVRNNLDDIAYYFNYLHYEVLRKLSNLIDIILELEEGSTYQLFKINQGDILNSSNGFARFLVYHPITDEYNQNTDSTWMRGHTDQGAFTLILSQPILSLQIWDYEAEKWKYVTHTPGALVINVADMVQQLTGGYFKSSIHRVGTAPPDQRQYNRNTAIYFSNVIPGAQLDVDTLNSPKLRRLGYARDPSAPRITAQQWDDEKGRFFNRYSAEKTDDINLFGRPVVGYMN